MQQLTVRISTIHPATCNKTNSSHSAFTQVTCNCVCFQ